MAEPKRIWNGDMQMFLFIWILIDFWWVKQRRSTWKGICRLLQLKLIEQSEENEKTEKAREREQEDIVAE